jgi:ABC-2 type transport system permease protein
LAGSISRIVAIARKEFVHISRDWRIIGAVLVLPLVQLLLFGYAISFDVRNIPTVVFDADNSAASRAYVAAATNSGFFVVKGHVKSFAQVDEAFNRSRARAAIVIARGFGQDIAANRGAQATVLLDGSEPNSAELGRTYAAALNLTFGARVLANWAASRGTPPPAAGALEPRIRTWYNPGRNSAAFLIPGLMAVIIMIVTVQQTAVTLVTERVEGTLEQLLISPLRQIELIVGKVAPWAILGFLDTVAITAVSMVVFNVPLRGDVFVLATGMFAFIVCALSIGMVISAVAPSIESANLVAILISFLPGFMLSGMAFPLDSIPPFLQGVSYLFPGRYMVEISRGVFLRGAGWSIMAVQVFYLFVYAAIALTLAAFLSRRQAGR